MIQWLRERFEARLQFHVILTIAVVGVVVGVVGAKFLGFFGFLAGAVIGCFFAFECCTVVFGRIATLICIANSAEANTKLLAEINSRLSDVEAIKNKVNTLDGTLLSSLAFDVGVIIN